MRLSVVVCDAHPVVADPRLALERGRTLVAAASGTLDGITVIHGVAASAGRPTPRAYPQALTVAAYLAAEAGSLGATVRGLPLGVLNPVELAEQLATVDHAWRGNFRASLAVGSGDAFAVFGIDPRLGPARFAEGLELIRRMWTNPSLVGTGPHFRFSEVRPTLRPVGAQGPALSLEVPDGDGLALAQQLDLGLHLGPREDIQEAIRLANAWRAAGGSGELSLELDIGRTTADTLTALAGARVDQVDLWMARTEVTPEAVRHVLDEVAHRRDGVGSR